MTHIRCMSCMKAYDGRYEICPFCGHQRSQEPANPLYLPEGTILDGKYLVGSVIGHGGFGITYAALDQSLELKVAVKEYFPYGLSTRTTESRTVYPVASRDAEDNYRYGREKFVEEARALARFNSLDSIVSVHTCFSENNTAYIVMEYLEGEDLMAHIKRRGGKLGWEETLTLLSPVTKALTALHREGLIHRDISPDNIFVTSDGKTKLLDFGTARFAMGEKSRSLSVILKPGYAPPEQYSSRGKQGPWTDVYALAATMYRCATGQAPPDAMERQMGVALERPSRLGADIPPAAEETLMRALEPEPEKRMQTIGELTDQMRRAADVKPAFEWEPQKSEPHDSGKSMGEAVSRLYGLRPPAPATPGSRKEEKDSTETKDRRRVIRNLAVIFALVTVFIILMLIALNGS
jgi:serine/threonine protein kinase